jgi:hypothetical protein
MNAPKSGDRVKKTDKIFAPKRADPLREATVLDDAL